MAIFNGVIFFRGNKNESSENNYVIKNRHSLKKRVLFHYQFERSENLPKRNKSKNES